MSLLPSLQPPKHCLGVQDLAKKYCDEPEEKVGKKLQEAVMAGGQEAEDAVAALLHAAEELQCLDSDQVFNIIVDSEKGEG